MSQVFIWSDVALWIFVIILAIGLFALYHHFGEMYLSSREGRVAQGPETGRSLKGAVGETIAGRRFELPVSNERTVLVFADTTCRLCGNLRAELPQFAEEQPDLAVAVVCAGAEDAVREWASPLGDAISVLADPGHRLATGYRVGVTPFVVVVDEFSVVRAKN